MAWNETCVMEQRFKFIETYFEGTSTFIQEYNEERPQEGLNNERPGWVHRVSERVYPGYVSEAEYD